MTPITLVLESAAMLVWLVVTAFFLERYFRFRRTASLALAVMSLGWAILGGYDLTRPALPHDRLTLPLLSLVTGILVGALILSAKRPRSSEGP